MHRIRHRVNALEARRTAGFMPFRCIRQYQDQTEAEAIALYEGDHGPVDTESENLLYVVIRKPFPSPVTA